LECRDLLNAGRAGYDYGFAALHLGLQAGRDVQLQRKCALRLGRLKDGGADREDEGRYNLAAGPSAQYSGT
jgi:hypothetical protein